MIHNEVAYRSSESTATDDMPCDIISVFVEGGRMISLGEMDNGLASPQYFSSLFSTLKTRQNWPS